MNSSQRLLIIDLDSVRIRQMQNRQAAVADAEPKLQAMADETGGMFHAPEEPATLLKFAVEVAHAIDSQYVITYQPDQSHRFLKVLRTQSPRQHPPRRRLPSAQGKM
jgi:hypothetical protein